MDCKKLLAGGMSYGIAAGVVALVPVVAQAAGSTTTESTTTTTTTTTTMGGTTMGGSATVSAEPVLVTGRVLRYYVDRSGYVTAMDVQTANGVSFVRFSPSMGERLYTQYPVGGTQDISVYVVGGADSRWDVVGMPSRMGGVTMMRPYMVSDLDLLAAEPYITTGTKLVTVNGKLRNVIVDEMGEVVGMVVRTNGSVETATSDKMMVMVGGQTMEARMTDGRMMVMGANGQWMETTMTNGRTTVTMPDGTISDVTMVNTTGGMSLMSGDTLVRVPREVRHGAPGYAGSERVTPLFRGANVEVTGYPEAPRYGALSAYTNRIAATTFVVNGRAVGAVSVPMMKMADVKPLFGTNIGGGTMSADEMRASGMGYTVYAPGMTTGGMMPGTMTTSDNTTR